ncbi:MAG: (d)CMP kinase [Clostridia bacterium]|nr:(d)CMP kinase [Clostridia bacterium]
MPGAGPIAIDGPAGAGKSTVARMVAHRLNYDYIDTGAMYRALALKAIEENIDCTDGESLESLVSRTDIRFERRGGKILVILDGRDVTAEIRKPEVGRIVSQVARVGGVRMRMVELQRKLASSGSVVMDGRDVGSYVLPDAPYKFFLTAPLEERARRRFQEMKEKGFITTLEDVCREIAERDALDSTREIGPLVRPPDAMVIDTSFLSPQQVVELILGYLSGEGRA